jgi:predicted nucleic acid-binding Zn ribbon protein
VLSRLFTSRGWGERQQRLRLEEAWREAAGALAAKSTQLGTLRRGVLEIIVKEAVLLQELAQFQKKSLLTKLETRLGDKTITDLRFRLGEF